MADAKKADNTKMYIIGLILLVVLLGAASFMQMKKSKGLQSKLDEKSNSETTDKKETKDTSSGMGGDDASSGMGGDDDDTASNDDDGRFMG